MNAPATPDASAAGEFSITVLDEPYTFRSAGELIARLENQPPGLALLYAALAKAQGEISSAEKGAENAHFHSKYSTLADVWAACREPLSANGLAVIQRARTSEGCVEVETTLAHSSGQAISETLTIRVGGGNNHAHAVGSAITYARRFALAAMVGVAPGEDDDGNAVGNTKEPPPREPSTRTRTRRPPADSKPAAEPSEDKIAPLRAKVKALFAELKDREGGSWSGICQAAGVRNPSAPNAAEFRALKDWINGRLDVLEKVGPKEDDQTPPEDDGDQSPAPYIPGDRPAPPGIDPETGEVLDAKAFAAWEAEEERRAIQEAEKAEEEAASAK